MRSSKWNVYQGWSDHDQAMRWYVTQPEAPLRTGAVCRTYEQALAVLTRAMRARAGIRSGEEARARRDWVVRS